MLPRPVEGVPVEPKEKLGVCPAGLNDELNNEFPEFWPVLKPVLDPKLKGADVGQNDGTPNPLIAGFTLNKDVPLLLTDVCPKFVKLVPDDVEGILNADLF